MTENKTQAEKFSNMADAIREVRYLSPDYKIVANNFDDEIKKANRFTNDHSEVFDNGYYGIRAAQCAASYRVAKITGQDEFVYTANESVFSTKQDETSKTRYVRDARGQAKIDCSTFVGLCLRNIPYDKSPYAKRHGASAE